MVLKLSRTVLLFLVVTTLLLSSSGFYRAYAAPGINNQIPFTGTLRDSSGTALTGTYDIVFRIYDASSGGSTLWTGTHSAGNGNAVSVDEGIFQVLLGSGTGNTLGLDFNDDTYWLGITVEADAEMTPRSRLGAAGYAFNSDTVDGLHGYEFVRASTTGRIEAAAATTLFTVVQNGAGNILDLYDGGSSVFSVADGGRTTVNEVFNQGAYYDDTNSAGTSGYVLQSTGTSTVWVATSTLGIGGGSLGASIDESELNILGAPTDGYILQASSSATGGFIWSATSSLGITGGITGTEGYAVTFDGAGSQTATSSLFFAGSGNIGVGTSSPASRLDVWGDFRVGTGSTAALFTDTSSGQVGVNDMTPDFALETVGAGIDGYFGVSNSESGDGNMFLIDEDGDVGVGTNNPLDKFHVSGGNILINNTQSIRGRSSGGSANTLMAYDSSNDLQIGSGILGSLDLRSNNEMLFQVGSTEYMRLTTSGALGINDSNPDFRLEVAGTSTSGYFAVSTVANGDGDLFNVSTAGNIGIGNPSPSILLHVGSSTVADSTSLLRLEDLNSTCNFNADAGGPTCGSDRTLKTDITAIDGELEIVLGLEPTYWRWKTDDSDAKLKSGFIAQDVERVLPELVSEHEWIDGSERKFLNIAGMMPYVVGAIKEVWQTVTGNQDRITDLEARITALESELDVDPPAPAPAPPVPDPVPEETETATTTDSGDESNEEVEEDEDLPPDTPEAIEEEDVEGEDPGSEEEPVVEVEDEESSVEVETVEDEEVEEVEV